MTECERFEEIISREPEILDSEEIDFYLLHQEVCPGEHADYNIGGHADTHLPDIDPSEFD